MRKMIAPKRSLWPLLLAVGVCTALVAPSAASAQDALSNPTASQYEPQSQVEGTSDTGSAPDNSGAVAQNTSGSGTSAASAGGTLPFTGMDLAVVAGIALLMMAVGFALRRLSAPRDL
jgi:hypothetical protein